MCLKLGNKRHCLTLLSILGGLQVLISLPIIALSFVVFFQTTLGAALSPFWCGFVVSAFEFSICLFLFIRLHKLFNQPYSQMGKLTMRYSHFGCVKHSLIFITSLDIEYIFTILHYHKHSYAIRRLMLNMFINSLPSNQSCTSKKLFGG